MYQEFADLATKAAAAAGFSGFRPDACLINRYAPGARLSLHQDRDERDFEQPIVSVSLGLPAIFLWGGRTRAARPRRLPLIHGDIVVWGGPDRLTFHGVNSLASGEHKLTGAYRFKFALIGIRGGGAHHATRTATRSPRRALPRHRALCTSWKKAR